MKFKKSLKIEYTGIILLTLFAISALSADLNAQEPPPRPIRITATGQGLSFGAFYQGVAGGTVIVAPNSGRTSTGSIVLLNMGSTVSAALFEVHAHPGTIIAVLNNNPYTITGGTPAGSMILNITSTNPASPFVSTVKFSDPIWLYVGGTLTVGNPAANPPGNYTGNFNITLVRE